MSFLSPGFLAGLLLLGPVVALYFLKTRPRVQPVPSNQLWRVVLSRVNPNSFLQRFHQSLFLVLQILAIVLAVLAAARPVASWLSGPLTTRIVILDVSASMQARDVAPSRFEAARTRAATLCREAPGRIALYTLGRTLTPLVRAGDSPELAAQAAGKLTPGHQATPDPERLLRLLRDLEGLSPDEIFLLTDTLDLEMPREFMPQTAIRVETFGSDDANVAIVGADLTPDETGRTLDASLSLVSEVSEAIDVGLVLEKADGSRTRLRTVTLPFRGRHTVDLPPLPTRQGIIRLEASPDRNRNPADDQWFFADPGRQPTVGLSAPRGSALFRLPRALPLISFQPVGASLPTPLPDAVLSLGSLPYAARRLPTAAFLPGPRPVVPGGILPWEADHPLVQFANWDAAPEACLRPSPTLPGTPLVEAVGGTLLAEDATQVDGRPVPHVWLAVDPDAPGVQGNFFLPIILFNVLEYLLRDKFPRLAYPVGHPGLAARWKGRPPVTAGWHEVPGHPGQVVGVNLEAPSEARIAPARSRGPTVTQLAGQGTRDLAGSPWPGLLSAALLLLLGEWYLYMRRN
ncbi:MAG: VWA domain-containing protein [Candidatus Riflebacteria bacterium]|nr:VWA domain-containing protein [Candidatus Riflebacteria bacterium]